MTERDRRTWHLWKVWVVVGLFVRVDVLILGIRWGWWL